MMALRAGIGIISAPLVVAILLSLAAALSRLLEHRRTASALLSCAGLLVYLASTPLVGQVLLHPLESEYGPLAALRVPPVSHVVVLGSGYRPHDAIPVTAALDSDGLVRDVEGIRLVRELRGAQLVVSGGARAGGQPVASGYAQLARDLGISEQSIVVCDRPLDTAAEARELSRLLGIQPFLLVTSAYHMPRAMRLLRQAGARPIAAPTGQRTFGTMRITWRAFVPGSDGLQDTERAVHEYLGLVANAWN